jgi:hypothetical protein
VGDSEHIYGMSINGGKIDREAAPDLMRPSDYNELYNSAIDVTSLPGGWAPKYGLTDVLEDLQRQADQTAMIVAQASSRRGRGCAPFDTIFRHKSRHSLGKISTRDDLFEFVSDLASSKKPAFQMTNNLLYSCLDKRHYSKTYIKRYQKHGLLPLLVRRTYASFFNLMSAIRQLAHDFPVWANGPAENMLQYHAKRIFHIRNYSVLKKQLVLQIYTYLRDAEHQDFEPTGMDKALWKANLQAKENVRDIIHSVLGEEGIGSADVSGGGGDGKGGTTCAVKPGGKKDSILGRRIRGLVKKDGELVGYEEKK